MSKPLTKEEILTTLRQQKDLLRTKFYVKNIGIFGSFARNEANENSDIDFLVEIDAPLEIYIKNRYALIDYLQNIFAREVDLANPSSLKPHYKERILKQAVYA
jgi:predicted nucleotidyltransferase